MATEEEVLKKLQNWVINENKAVSGKFLLRNTKLNAKQVQSVLKTFLKDQKDGEHSLTASYIVFGKALGKKLGGEDVGDRTVIKSTICTEDKLEKVCKEAFVEVNQKSIFSIQKGSLKNLIRPLNNIYAGCIKAPVVKIEDRLNIVNSVAAKDVKKDIKDVKLDEIELPLLEPRVKRGPKVFIKKIVVKKDQHGIKEAFAKSEAIVDEEPEVVPSKPSSSVLKRVEKFELPVEPKTKKNGCANSKKDKSKKDNKKEFNWGKVTENLKTEEEEAEPEVVPKNKKSDSFDDDLFSTEDNVHGSVLHEDKPKVLSKVRQEEEDDDEEIVAAKRRRIISDDDDEEQMETEAESITHTEENKKKEFEPVHYKKQEVVEEYVDEDGMTVTKTTVKLVKEEPSPSNSQPVKAKPKPVLKPSNTTSKGPKKAPAGQPTISSFFTKK
ncbi:unnamed protein product [Bursaphelenchus okinawaensis]|uniref:DNA polymerase delta subunit 3 n=1 Tax=Bursaphelenchus okinawaensis TaxID=465554 RepID=A0A811LR68_9BILA|nr:unnamed protein product [Bursaphelenchus okinawaensis]CAG9126951.1 unnamed protein product [Bursaphelenchus okinawaensis]